MTFLLFTTVFGTRTYKLVLGTNYFTIIQLLHDGLPFTTNKWLYLPKVESNTEKSTKRQLFYHMVDVLVFNLIHYKKASRSTRINERADLIPTFLIA